MTESFFRCYLSRVLTHGHSLRLLRSLTAIATGSASFLVLSGSSWACIPQAPPTITVTPDQATPGSEVVITGFNFVRKEPVVVRLNSLSGRVLGRFDLVAGRPFPGFVPVAGELDATVTIPSDASPGVSFLVLTQENSDGSAAVIPSRVAITLTTTERTEAEPTDKAERPQTLTGGADTPDVATLVFTGAAVALVALAVGGLGVLVVARRRGGTGLAGSTEGGRTR